MCLLLGSSLLTVEGGRHTRAAGVLHRRGGRAVLAVLVSVGGWCPNSQLSPLRRHTSEFSGGCGGLARRRDGSSSSNSKVGSRYEEALEFLAKQERGCYLVAIERVSDDRVMHMQVRSGDEDVPEPPPLPLHSAEGFGDANGRWALTDRRSRERRRRRRGRLHLQASESHALLRIRMKPSEQADRALLRRTTISVAQAL